MFRWSVSRLIPPVSYLTLLDQYTLLSLIFISLNSIWHSIVGFLIRRLGFTQSLDYYALSVFIVFFVVYHCVIGFSLYQALNHRQLMLEIERQYARKLADLDRQSAQ